MEKSNWKHSVHYQRILEILEFYWLEEPDELRVRVSMDFLKANGEEQHKIINWINPNYDYVGDNQELFSLSAIVAGADIRTKDLWDYTKYKKTTSEAYKGKD